MKDRVVLVTGGASGIGRAVALLAAERGASVAVVDRDAQGALATGTQAVQLNRGKTLALTVDVANESAVLKAFAEVEKQMGVPTAVFAGAGIDQGVLAHELPAETWRAVLSANLDGVFFTARTAIATLLRHNLSGSIVCASSPAAMLVLPRAVRAPIAPRNEGSAPLFGALPSIMRDMEFVGMRLCQVLQRLR